MTREWLETDGRGGFASGCAIGPRTRRYHALLLHSVVPPTHRYVLVNGYEVQIKTPRGAWHIVAQRYHPDVTTEGGEYVTSFTHEPWPQWRYRLPDGTELLHELFVPRGRAAIVLSWRLLQPAAGVRLIVRPFLSGRDIHSTHHENSAFRFDAAQDGESVQWRPYPDVPGVIASSNGVYEHEPQWYRGFQYDEERARGLDFLEDLAAPGIFTFELSSRPAELILTADSERISRAQLEPIRDAELKRRAGFKSALRRAADTYIVERGDSLGIIAGYPWFSDWGRDTFIAVRGLCITAGRLAEARRILGGWAAQVSGGMLPNYFPEAGQAPEYNSVDASLWYAIAVQDLLNALQQRGQRLPATEQSLLTGAVQKILEGYARGTRYGIRADADGLLAAGVPGVQLTWMDARVGERVITPRIGKPVEVQALWINALRIGSSMDSRWHELHDRAIASFRARFAAPAGLYDVIDVDHQRGVNDPSVRPNQLLAVGGLPYSLFDLSNADDLRVARSVVDLAEQELWTPLGPRSLSPNDPHYIPHYEGSVAERDGAYHQGTVWPWLAGAFIEAWLRVRGGTDEARAEARERFVLPLMSHLDDAGLGHVSEIADADPPHTPRGAPFQAWSLGELIRVDALTSARTRRRATAELTA